MNSDNLTDAINFELFKSGIESFQEQAKQQIDDLISCSFTFFEELSKYWASENAVKFANGVKSSIVFQLRIMAEQYNKLGNGLIAVAEEWSKSLHDQGLNCNYSEINLGDSYKLDDSGCPVIGLTFEGGASGIIPKNEQDVYACLDAFVEGFRKHLEDIKKITSLGFGLKSTDGSISDLINHVVEVLEVGCEGRIRLMLSDVKKKLGRDISEVKSGERAASEYLEGATTSF